MGSDWLTLINLRAWEMTRFVCISDTHGLHESMRPIPDGDVLIHAGDFTDTGQIEQVESTLEFLRGLPHKHKIIIAGNHDISVQPNFYAENYHRFHRSPVDVARVREMLTSNDGFIYLEDQEVTVEGFKIYGSPWQPEFCNWAFNLSRGAPCREKWENIPSDTDILVTHGPPSGHGDKLPTGEHVGCEDLLRAIQTRVRPSHHVFGHVHEGYGTSSDGTTTFINASSCTLAYQPHNDPIVFDLPSRLHKEAESA